MLAVRAQEHRDLERFHGREGSLAALLGSRPVKVRGDASRLYREAVIKSHGRVGTAFSDMDEFERPRRGMLARGHNLKSPAGKDFAAATAPARFSPVPADWLTPKQVFDREQLRTPTGSEGRHAEVFRTPGRQARRHSTGTNGRPHSPGDDLGLETLPSTPATGSRRQASKPVRRPGTRRTDATSSAIKGLGNVLDEQVHQDATAFKGKVRQPIPGTDDWARPVSRGKPMAVFLDESATASLTGLSPNSEAPPAERTRHTPQPTPAVSPRSSESMPVQCQWAAARAGSSGRTRERRPPPLAEDVLPAPGSAVSPPLRWSGSRDGQPSPALQGLRRTGVSTPGGDRSDSVSNNFVLEDLDFDEVNLDADPRFGISSRGEGRPKKGRDSRPSGRRSKLAAKPGSAARGPRSDDRQPESPAGLGTRPFETSLTQDFLDLFARQ